MSGGGPPPYFNIPPDRALSQLGDPTDTKDLARISETYRRGWQDMTGSGLPEDDRRVLRPFSTWEITTYLIPVAPQHFRRVLRQNPDLPQGRSETEGGARWFTLEEVLRLRAFFGAEGSRSKEYLPYRPKGLPARIVAIANVKGGVGKTATCAHLAMSAAMDGYRVLTIDLDSQGALSSMFGVRAEDEWQTVFPLLARHYGETLRTDNQRRIDRGEPPVALDDTLAKALKIRASDLIRPTHWPNVDMIGAQLTLTRAEFQIPLWRMASRNWKQWSALTDSLAADGVLDRYDLILIDTPPALGYLTINGLAAADIVLVPLGASLAEFEATGRFFDLLHSTFSAIEESENIAARALGREELHFEWDAIRAVMTRYDADRQAETAALIQAHLGPGLSPHRQDFTALIGQAGAPVRGIYEIDYRDLNRETYARSRESFDRTYAAFKALLLGLWRRDELKRG